MLASFAAPRVRSCSHETLLVLRAPAPEMPRNSASDLAARSSRRSEIRAERPLESIRRGRAPSRDPQNASWAFGTGASETAPTPNVWSPMTVWGSKPSARIRARSPVHPRPTAIRASGGRFGSFPSTVRGSGASIELPLDRVPPSGASGSGRSLGAGSARGVVADEDGAMAERGGPRADARASAKPATGERALLHDDHRDGTRLGPRQALGPPPPDT
jgi:hypothetical protein